MGACRFTILMYIVSAIQITIEKDLEKGFDYRKISVNEQ